MKQGCIIVNPELIANPDVFDCLLNNFELVRQLEIDNNTHVMIVENEAFKDVPIGGRLYFYNLDFARVKSTGELYLSKINEAFYHPTLNFICQRKQEPPKVETPENPEEMFPGLM